MWKLFWELLNQLLTFWFPLILTLSTIFEINIIYKRTIKGYYEIQEFRYQGERKIDNEEELAKFHKSMHQVLQKSVGLQRFGLKRLHLCEFWCVYWMVTFAINDQLLPLFGKLGVLGRLLTVIRLMIPFTLYILIHERPSHKNSDPQRPWRFPKYIAEVYKLRILPITIYIMSLLKHDITAERLHMVIKHVNGTIAASDFDLFGVESRQIFYFESHFEEKGEPTTLTIANMAVEPETVINSSRSSLISNIYPTETIPREHSLNKVKSKNDSRRKVVTRLNNLFRHKN